MNDEKREIPQSDEYGTPNAQAYDEHGNVRPADARWLGDHNDDLTPEQRIEIREQEIADADAALQERLAKANNPDEDGDQPATDAPVEEEPVTEEEPVVLTPDPSLPEDRYADMQYAELQQEAKGREINAGGTADEIRARLLAADADANSGITQA